MQTVQITIRQAVQIVGSKKKLIDLARQYATSERLSLQLLVCTGAKLCVSLDHQGKPRFILGGYHCLNEDTQDVLEAIRLGLRGLLWEDRDWGR